MAGYEITAELNLKKIAAEVKEFAKAMNEFANALEQIEKKYADDIPHETVTEFADRCKECGARYGKLLKQKSDMLDKIKEEIEAQSRMHMDGDLYIKVSECMQIIDKYKEGSGE